MSDDSQQRPGETGRQYAARVAREVRERQQQRGRRAVEDAEPFDAEDGGAAGAPPRTPPAGDDDGDDGDDDAPPPGPDLKVYKWRRIPRIDAEGHIRWVVNSVPDDCPVRPLGAVGLVSWFLNPRGELIGMDAGKFGLTHIKGLFGSKIGYAERAWPKIDKQEVWKGFAAENIQDALIASADAKGVFDPAQKVRGRGCWRAEDGRLIQHLGDRVLVGSVEHRPGEIAESDEATYVYPARPKLIAPKAGGKADCEAIYGHLNSWNWERGELDARLLLGWMACVVLGGALDWRPMVFWMGDAGTGKSTLQGLVRNLLQGRLIKTVDATPASLAQLLGADSLGVAFDELEADALTDQAQHVMKLARTAASGDMRLRGGQDHKAVEFQLRGCFGFSAINPPSMRQQDVQRFAFLRLKRLATGAKAPKVPAADLRDLAAGLVGRVAEGWARWDETLELFRQGLERVGHAQRGMDQFGTLLAAADVLLHDELPDADTVDQWCAGLARRELYEYAEVEDNWLKVWRLLLAAQPEAWRSLSFPTVAEMVQRWWRAANKKGDEDSQDPNIHQRNLNRAGLAIVVDARKRPWLAIPSDHPAISSIFAGTDYQARGGGGVWTNALRGAPKFEYGAGVWRMQQCRQLQRIQTTMFRLDAVVEINGARQPIFDFGEDEGESDEARAYLAQGYEAKPD